MQNKAESVQQASDNSRDFIQCCYLDWLNNFVSYDTFASVYDITLEEATVIINTGRRIHKERTA